MTLPKIPQPFLVETLGPSSPSASPWAEPTRFLREIARWITGGMIATVAAVATGSSLTRLGSLDPIQDKLRLGLALVGLMLAMTGVGLLLWRAIAVLRVESGHLEDIANAESGNPLYSLRKKVEEKFRFKENSYLWEDILKLNSELGNHIEQAVPYFYVRQEFDKLLKYLPYAGFIAFSGLIIFAWAANPEEKKSFSRHSVEIKLIY